MTGAAPPEVRAVPWAGDGIVVRAILLLGSALVLIGALVGDHVSVAAGTFALGTGYGLRCYGRDSRVDVVGIFVFSAGIWFGLSNFLGYLSRGGAYESVFFVWQDDRSLFIAQLVGASGVIVPAVFNEVLLANRRGDGWRPLLCPPPAPSSDGTVFAVSAVLVVAGWVLRILSGMAWPSGFMGQVGDLVIHGPNIAIFVLSSRIAELRGRPSRGSVAALVLLVATEVAFAGLYSTMRMHLVLPVLAFFLPRVLARRLTLVHAGALVFLVAAFGVVFETMAGFRLSNERGLERAEALRTMGEDWDTGGGAGGTMLDGSVAVMGRLSTFNQLSRVVAITEEDGFVNGETLKYLPLAVIPRVLWREKPEVATGQWFAERLGRGRATERGWSNAVNMTVPGELYLNFSWLGIVGGLSLLTLLYRVLWDGCRAGITGADPVGWIVGYFAVAQAVFVGSHAGTLVQIFTLWALLVILRWAQHLFLRRGDAAGEVRLSRGHGTSSGGSGRWSSS